MQTQARRDAERAAEALARMLRIKTAQDADSFAKEHPALFPQPVWKWNIREVPPGVSVTPLPKPPVVPFWQAYQRVLAEAWREKFPRNAAIRLLVAPVAQGVDALSSLPTHAYQQGIMLLALEPWRCRYCAACGQPFAAKIPADRYCSRACFESQRRAAKLDWWRREGSRRRQHEQGRKKSRKQSKFGHRRTKR